MVCPPFLKLQPYFIGGFGGFWFQLWHKITSFIFRIILPTYTIFIVSGHVLKVTFCVQTVAFVSHKGFLPTILNPWFVCQNKSKCLKVCRKLDTPGSAGESLYRQELRQESAQCVVISTNQCLFQTAF